MGVRQFGYGPMTVHTNGTGTYLFFSMTAVMETSRLKSVKVAIELCNSTGNLTMVAGYQVSNDQLTWTGTTTLMDSQGTPAPIVSLTADGTDFSGEWVEVDAAVEGYLFIRFGVQVKNTDTQYTEHELGLASLRLDIRSC